MPEPCSPTRAVLILASNERTGATAPETVAAIRLHSVPDVVASPPPGRARLIVSLVVLSWLLWQVTVPLAYYVAPDVMGLAPEEPRFRWRMFSQVWFSQRECNVSAFEVREAAAGSEAVRPLDLGQRLDSIWNKQLWGKRQSVVRKFLQSRCDSDPSVIQVEFMRTCPAAPFFPLPEVNLRPSCLFG